MNFIRKFSLPLTLLVFSLLHLHNCCFSPFWCVYHLFSSLSPPLAVVLTSTQVALQGVEKAGFIVCSSYVTQIFGREHDPVWREGDLVAKNSWVAKIQDLQYFSTIDQQPGATDDNQQIPWLPLSVIKNPDPPPNSSEPQEHTLPTAEEEQADISLLLKQLGPDLKHPEGAQIGNNKYPGDAVGGMVNTMMGQGMVVEGTAIFVFIFPPLCSLSF